MSLGFESGAAGQRSLLNLELLASIARTIDPHKFLKIRLYAHGINPELESIQD
jgi:hypothetical protein